MKMASCGAKAQATYSASQELSFTRVSETQASFLETQDTPLPSLSTLKQKPEVDFLSFSSVAQSESDYTKSSNSAPPVITKVRLIDGL